MTIQDQIHKMYDDCKILEVRSDNATWFSVEVADPSDALKIHNSLIGNDKLWPTLHNLTDGNILIKVKYFEVNHQIGSC